MTAIAHAYLENTSITVNINTVNHCQSPSITDTQDNILPFMHFLIYRRDRPTHGGGLLLGVKDSIASKLIYVSDIFEILCIEVCLIKTTRIILVYLPSITNVDYLTKFFHEIFKLTNTVYPYILIGDFNYPEVNWTSFSFPNHESYKIFRNFCKSITPFEQ